MDSGSLRRQHRRRLLEIASGQVSLRRPGDCPLFFFLFFPRQPSPVRPVFNIVLLASTQFGNVTCDAEEKDNGARFEIIVPESAAGKWAFRHPERGYFLGASADKLVCSAKTPTENELW